MASWRDDASPQAQTDLDDLLDQSLGYAEQQLPQGTFAPVAFTVALDGTTEMAAVGWEDGETPTGSQVLDALRAGLRTNARAYRASAVVYDAARPDGSDVVQVELEHREGVALTVLMPYLRRGDGIEPQALEANRGLARTWSPEA